MACETRAKPGRGKPVLIMHIGFLACFHAISLERSRFSKIATYFSCPCSTEAVGIAHKQPIRQIKFSANISCHTVVYQLYSIRIKLNSSKTRSVINIIMNFGLFSYFSLASTSFLVLRVNAPTNTLIITRMHIIMWPSCNLHLLRE